jgi:hypothetical protein
MLTHKLALTIPLLLLTCCSSSPEIAPRGGPSGAHYTFTFTTAPGKETHYCQYMKMPESPSGEVLVTGYDWTWQDMHHWGLYRTTSDLPAGVSLDTPFDCFAPGAMKYAAPAALQLAAGDVREQSFPEGTAFAFKSGEIVVFQAHTLNTTTADIHPSIDLTVKLGDPAVTPNRLGLIQFYDPYIYVPAHTQAQAHMRCEIPRDMTLVQSTTHQHTRGTGVDVLLDPADGSASQPLLSNPDWEHPSTSTKLWTLEKGSHISTSCSYLGDDHDVIQGQDKQDNEMCMFVGYYYPAIEDGATFEICAQTPLPGGVGDGYGTGKKSCSESLSCIQTCPPGDAPNFTDGRIDVGACWQRCLVDSCESAAAPLDALGYCVRSHCADACSGGDCASCVAASCSSQYSACLSQGC